MLFLEIYPSTSFFAFADKRFSCFGQVRDPGDASQTFFISCDKLINAAGPWSGYLMQSIGVDLPVRPRKRYVFSFDCPKGPKDMLLAVDISGCWFRKEGSGSLYICGKSPSEVRFVFVRMGRVKARSNELGMNE